MAGSDHGKRTPTPEQQTVRYSVSGEVDPIDFVFQTANQSIWATQAQIARLFTTDQSGVSRHLRNVFSEGELDRESNMQKMHIAGSSKPTTFYSLDAIISVGYRVNSRRATAFRQWATGILTSFVEQGFVLNEEALRRSPDKLNALAEQVRALRSEEKQIYQKVRDCFAISASDYQPSSKEAKKFFALLQDKFLHAVTKSTSSKLIMDRSDHLDDNCGLQTIAGKEPTVREVEVGKNYLQKEEIYRLHLLSEQFLLYAESTALAGKKMTMKSLHEQLDRVLILNEYPVFDGYKDSLRDEAVRHARAELERYRTRRKIEELGYEYDEEAHALGEYDEALRGGCNRGIEQ